MQIIRKLRKNILYSHMTTSVYFQMIHMHLQNNDDPIFDYQNENLGVPIFLN